MSPKLHQFIPYVEPRNEDHTAFDWSACVTGDPQRMQALFDETDHLARLASGSGHLARPVEADPSALLIDVLPAAAAPGREDRCASYQEQLAYLAGLELERRGMEQIREAA